ncbi:MAG TPA: class I SAM-dependent methyltransferase [Geminicoccaceae bacterium]|nr:class I SAM-dependent methyltransferase [Geminicoccaceae bacterium]
MQFCDRGFTDRIVQYFDDQAEQWNAEHGPDSPRASDFLACVDYLARLCRELDRPRVLDVGCASGQHLLHLAPEIRAGVGVDVASRMIERARAAAGRHGAFGHLRFQFGDARTLAREALGRFDLALFVGVLEHVPDRLGALRAAADLLDAGGRLVVVMPNPQQPACPLGPLRRRRPVPIFTSDRHYTVRELAAEGRRAKLAAERVDAVSAAGPFGRGDDEASARAAAAGVPVTATWDTFAMRFRRADDGRA